MAVHSFSPTNEWLEDYQYFLSMFGLKGQVHEVVSTLLPSGESLHFAWVRGDERFLWMWMPDIEISENVQ